MLRDPEFVQAADSEWYQRHFDETGDDYRESRPTPMFTKFRLRELELRNRVVMSPMAQYSADENGNLTTSSMVNYLVPSATELPNYELARTVTPSPTNPMGVKGIGEAGTIASTPAVINAVVDALSHLGVTNVEMPASPERVWRAIEQAKGGK